MFVLNALCGKIVSNYKEVYPMIIDFNKIELSVLENFKGGEKATEAHMFVDENNRMLMGRLVPGASIGLHRHEGNSEVVLIKKGTGKVLFEGEYIPLKEGDVHYCPEGCEHSLINDSEEDLLFFGIVPNHK